MHRRSAYGLCGRWVRSLLKRGLIYQIVELERPRMREHLDDAERWWIAYGRLSHWPLTNMTDGGDGAAYGERNPMASPKTVAKVAMWHRGKKLSTETRTSISKAALARGDNHHFRSETHREAVRQRSLTKNPMKNPNVVAKMLKARAATWTGHNDESKEKLRQAQNVTWAKPGYREAASMRLKVRMKDPSVRAKISVARREYASLHPPPCGTLSGYQRAIKSRRQGLEHCGPCTDCLRASADYAAMKRTHWAASRLYCKNGHPMFGRDLHYTGRGDQRKRFCWVCREASFRRFRIKT